MNKSERNQRKLDKGPDALDAGIEQPSLFSYYIQAAYLACRFGVGLDYAFRRYVKPTMISDAPIRPFSRDEWDNIVCKDPDVLNS